jgi:hypothetical protein
MHRPALVVYATGIHTVARGTLYARANNLRLNAWAANSSLRVHLLSSSSAALQRSIVQYCHVVPAVSAVDIPYYHRVKRPVVLAASASFEVATRFQLPTLETGSLLSAV